MYWLDLDYLDVAAAALRCAASLTSLLYVEYWCEEQGGALQLPQPQAQAEVRLVSWHLLPAADCSALSRAIAAIVRASRHLHRLNATLAWVIMQQPVHAAGQCCRYHGSSSCFLTYIGQINEPDGLHAICHMSHGLDPLSQLRLYQQEGAWAAVLTTCDHQLRRRRASACLSA